MMIIKHIVYDNFDRYNIEQYAEKNRCENLKLGLKLFYFPCNLQALVKRF